MKSYSLKLLCAVVAVVCSTGFASEPSKIGVGVIGRTIGHSGTFESPAMFKHIAQDSQFSIEPRDGRELFDLLGDASKELGCIPRLTWAGHGWGEDNKAGGDGLPLDTNDNGFYFERRSARRAVSMADFKSQVRRKKIRFCDDCLIQIHACNVAFHFVRELAHASGCSVVSGMGRVSPVDTADGRYDYIWLSTPVKDNTCKLPDGTACGGEFVRVAPNGSFERLGRRYVSER